MKILEIEIQNIRGIRSLKLYTNGKNLVIWGPNGSGKSTVVDAIDFLLTGKMQRLMGSGTSGITLKKHGTHILEQPEKAFVKAVVQIPGLSNSIEISRCLAEPNNLVCDEEFKLHFTPIVELASRGQHILTRRELLKYITAEAGKRAEEIQALLGITEVEDIRKALVKVCNSLSKDAESAKRVVERARGAINATLQLRRFDYSEIVNLVNQHRLILNAQPITELSSVKVKSGIKPVTLKSNSSISEANALMKDVENIRRVFTEKSKSEILEIDMRLRRDVTYVLANPHLRTALRRRQLIELGQKLIDDSGNCPLCDKEWEPGELAQYLNLRIEQAGNAESQ